MTERVWLVTGASSGFGRAITQAAIAAGDLVVAAVRRPDSVADLVAAHPGRVQAVRLDVTDIPRIDVAVAEVLDTHGRIDVLVNNAGRGLAGAAEDTTDAELRALMDLHFFGPVALVRAVLPAMRAQRSGAIVQMSSQGGRLSFPGISAYSATKFALEGWSEALSGEVRPFGIHVMIVEPGAFRTSFNEPGALLVTRSSDVYAEQVGPVLTQLQQVDGSQPGDPVKGAAAILTALDARTPPLRLPLGVDAAENLARSLETTQAELAAWESLSRSTDLGRQAPALAPSPVER
jgi:NAD(P)-dependent dehydrogenase (short-subunit alcohol dehydrogenase family)